MKVILLKDHDGHKAGDVYHIKPSEAGHALIASGVARALKAKGAAEVPVAPPAVTPLAEPVAEPVHVKKRRGVFGSGEGL